MKNVMSDYLTSYIANDLISISTALAIKQVLNSKCRYRAPRIISFSVSWEDVPSLYPKSMVCSNKCYKCDNGKLLVKVR